MKKKTILDYIGNTPIVPINRLNPYPGVTIFAKIESFNPAGSVKERIALSMIETAEASGALILTILYKIAISVQAKEA